jgi:hypothetical protein
MAISHVAIGPPILAIRGEIKRLSGSGAGQVKGLSVGVPPRNFLQLGPDVPRNFLEIRHQALRVPENIVIDPLENEVLPSVLVPGFDQEGVIDVAYFDKPVADVDSFDLEIGKDASEVRFFFFQLSQTLFSDFFRINPLPDKLPDA